jgi:hypothetical protein
MKAKLVLVLEDHGSDEGCTHDILQTCVNHGFTILEARFENEDGSTQDIRHQAEFVTPEPGKC